MDYEEVPPPLPCILNAGRSLLAALLWLLTRVIIEVGECRLLVLVSSRQVRSSLASLGLPSPHLFVCAMDYEGSAAASPLHFEWRGELAGGLSAADCDHRYIRVPPPCSCLFGACEELLASL